jgi:hypothetical protein
MDKVKVITLKNGQVIVGVPVYAAPDSEEKIIEIIKPQALMPAQGGLQLVDLYGAPDKIQLFDQPVYIAELNDKDIKKAYVKATTGLLLPN